MSCIPLTFENISWVITAHTKEKKVFKKTQKKAQNSALKFEKHTKSMKNIFLNYFARAVAETFLRVTKLINFIRFFLCRIFFKINCSSETEAAKLFESTTHKCLWIYLNLLLSFLDYHFWEIFVIIFEFQNSELKKFIEHARPTFRVHFKNLARGARASHP